MQSFTFDNRDVIRIRVKKTDGLKQPEYRKFSVAPQLTSFEVLQSLLAKAFAITSDFTISYLAKDHLGEDVFLSLLSDWDLDAAFEMAASTDDCLRLKVDLRPFDESLDDWDIVAPREIPPSHHNQTQVIVSQQQTKGSFFNSLSGHVGNAISSVQKAFGIKNGVLPQQASLLRKPPMDEAEYRSYMDTDGRLKEPKDFYLSVFQGGVQASLRRMAWRQLLNVFPEGLSGQERYDYMKSKCREYYALLAEWRDELASSGNEEIKCIVNTVKKDVLRTDRNHSFYAGSDDSQNLLSLLNILVTYAITHPEVSYCQGMSDMASPILMVQRDEAEAYVCFCGLMQTRWENFTLDGTKMGIKFKHLNLLLQKYDPQFYLYLRSQDADDLFFCFRWLLLEMKREFPLDDAPLVMEIQWGSVPPRYPDTDLKLADRDYTIQQYVQNCLPHSPTVIGESVYTRLKAELCRHHFSPSSVLTSKRGPQRFTSCPAGSACLSRARILSDGRSNSLAGTCQLDEAAGDPQAIRRNQLLLTPNEEEKFLEESVSDYLSDAMNDPVAKQMIERSNNLDQAFNSLGVANGRTDCTPTGSVSGLSTQEYDGDGQTLFQQTMPGDKHSAQHCRDDVTPKVSESHSDEDPQTPQSSGAVVCNADTNTSTSESAPETLDSPETPDSPTERDRTKSGDSCFVASVLSSCEAENTELSAIFHQNNASLQRVILSNDEPIHNDDIPRHRVSSSGVDSSSSRNSQSVIQSEDSGVQICATDLSETSASKPTSIKSVKKSDEALTNLHVGDDYGDSVVLPCPEELGAGNPFLLFLCLTLFLQHRDYIMLHKMDYNEIAMYFDRMVRKHNVYKVLQHAQMLYTDYLKVMSFRELEASGDSSDAKFDLSL